MLKIQLTVAVNVISSKDKSWLMMEQMKNRYKRTVLITSF